MLKCKKCSSTTYVKSGHVRGHQRYQCKSCKCQFTDTQPRGVHPTIKTLAIVLYAHCGVPMMGIAKIFKVSTVAVLKWVRQFSDTIELPEQQAEIVQMDELWHFVNGKKTPFESGESLMGYRVALSDGDWVVVAMPAFGRLLSR